MSEYQLDDEFMAQMLADFLDESEGYLTRLNENLLEIDELCQSGSDEIKIDLDKLNEMFRDAHSLKGLSAMLQLNDINRLTHKIENVFDAARNDQILISSKVVEVVFGSLDCLTKMIEELSSPDPQIVEYESLVGELSKLLATPASNSEAPESKSTNDVEPQAKPLVTLDVVDDISEVPEKYLSFFVDETDQTLDELTETLDECSEMDPADALSRLLTLSHRIKGSAASIGLNRTTKLSHLMEDLIQDMRDRKASITNEFSDVFRFAVDSIRDHVVVLRSGADDPDNYEEPYQKLVEFRQQFSAIEKKELEKAQDQELENSTNEKQLTDFIEQVRALDNVSGKQVVGRINFDADLLLPNIKARLTADRLADQGALAATSPSEDEFEDLQTMSHFLFAILPNGSMEQLENSIQMAGLTSVEMQEVDFTAPIRGNSAPESLTEEKTKQAKPAEEKYTTKPTCSAEPQAKPASPAAKPKPKTEEKAKDRPIETIRVEIDRLDNLMNQAGQLVINKARFARLHEQFKSQGNAKHLNQSLANASILAEKIRNSIRENVQADDASNGCWEAIDTQIQMLTNELEGAQANSMRVKETRALVNDLAEAVHQLDRVAEGIQKSVMDTRMVPIGPLFGRFKRVVRDYTKGSNKSIQLVIRGDKTELDKRMIDELGDPLIHMVRNSADHGIELPEDRVANGKPKSGTISLDAYHRGNQVYVEVSDDGKGLHADMLRRKAVSKGIISEEDAARLDDKQALQLIWEPGFSTAEKVTEISGRGMGMDIVRAKIEKLNGSVEIDSQPGEGTQITIKLPLTMAILPSLLTVIAKEVFAIPVESVLEIVRVRTEDISTVHGARTVVIRGRVISVIELDSLLQFNLTEKRDISEQKEQTLVIIGGVGNELGLVVEDLLGEEDIVIKSLAENFRDVNGLAGASILGDGRVSLILDVAAIEDIACNPKRSTQTMSSLCAT